jgi:hypothetical protein
LLLNHLKLVLNEPALGAFLLLNVAAVGLSGVSLLPLLARVGPDQVLNQVVRLQLKLELWFELLKGIVNFVIAMALNELIVLLFQHFPLQLQVRVQTPHGLLVALTVRGVALLRVSFQSSDLHPDVPAGVAVRGHAI